MARHSPLGQRGLTLIELMVAMVLGLLVAAGIITVFASTNSSSKAQNQMARLQEEGRFAITRISDDLRMANGQYCTNSGGVARPAAASQVFLDGLRSPKVYAKAITGAMSDVTTPVTTVLYPLTSAPYSFPSFLSMRGYDCSLTTCLPVDPSTTVTDIPAMGTDVGDRVEGADVVTVRYVNSSRGWTVVGGTGTSIATGATVGSPISSITLVPDTSIGEPPVTDFTGDMAMLADCSNAQIFAVTKSGGVLTPDTANNLAAPVPQQPLSAPKVFDFSRDYQTVTYYLKLVDDGNGQKTGALVRRLNGGTTNPGGSEDELVRGVERLDFRYGVEDKDGKIRFLSAKDVDAATGISCPPGEPDPITTNGCLWRAISSIEVSLVIDGQIPLHTLTANDLVYSYGIDGNSTPVAPSAHAIKPTDQGFVDPMLRREFTALVSVRNFNP
ncbi:PilW family protein [Rhodanobacter sp. T12-5]|uniref:PilW family protein n=1 Tax=Rhodanobacter sp. T12-5 TaxID=2024611 RepID=UPI0011ED8BDB|nr:PilW family protein [Rhodanobacter sp. T12-5]KAA0070347.1 prepilin-type N-terminal cleavage/methylation domain-containing protein [Rhodanobacter sp. T12-5]